MDINIKTVPMDQKNTTPKDMAGQKFTTDAGTLSNGGKYTARDYKCASMKPTKPQG